MQGSIVAGRAPDGLIEILFVWLVSMREGAEIDFLSQLGI